MPKVESRKPTTPTARKAKAPKTRKPKIPTPAPATTPLDPRAILAEIAADKRAAPTSRVNAANGLLREERRAKPEAADVSDATRDRALAILRRDRAGLRFSMPIVGEHAGMHLHRWQDADRLDLVRAEIDRIHSMTGMSELLAYLNTRADPVEARLLAGGKLRPCVRSGLRSASRHRSRSRTSSRS